MNYSNYKFLDRIVKSGDYVTQLISKTKNPEVNSPIHTYNTISAHFTPEGLAPGS